MPVRPLAVLTRSGGKSRVVLKKTESVSSEELICFCCEKPAPCKSSKSIVFNEDLPRNAIGKVQKA